MTQSALASRHVHVWRTMVTGSPSYATRSVTLTVVVSTTRQETFTSVSSQTFISFFKQPAAARPKGVTYISTCTGINFHPIDKPFEMGAYLGAIKPPIFLFDHWMLENRNFRHFLKKFDIIILSCWGLKMGQFFQQKKYQFWDLNCSKSVKLL